MIAQMLRQSLATQPYALATITSGSMRPLFDIGDQIGLTAVSLMELKQGDIITLETPTHLLTHRLYALTPTHVITRGDRVSTFDPPTRHEQLIGRVVIRRRQDEILDLEQGRGRALHGALCQLALHEAQHFSRPYWTWRPVRRIIHMSYTLYAKWLVRRL